VSPRTVAERAVPNPSVFSVPPGFDRLQHAPAAGPVLETGVAGVWLDQLDGLDVVRVETADATAAIALFGGQLLSYVPRGGQDVFWRSPLRAPLPTPVRGGAPVCWPFFGRQGQAADVPSHGFARTVPWRLQQARAGEEGITVVLGLPDLPGLPLRLHTEIHVGRRLRQRLVTTHAGDAPLVITEALHNYFAVADVGAVRVAGLDGQPYLDRHDGQRMHRQVGDWTLHDPRDPGRSDRTYPGAGGHYRLLDPPMARVIDLQVRGGRSVVVWNPGQAGGAAMTDVGPHWQRFLCVEAANAGPDGVALAPGASHVLEQVIQVLPLV